MFSFLSKLNKRQKSIPAEHPSWSALQPFTPYASISPREALQISAVQACVSILVNSLSALPASIVRNGAVVKRHRLSPALRDGDGSGRYTWHNIVGLLATDYLLHGGAYLLWQSQQGRETLTPIPFTSVSPNYYANRQVSYSISLPYLSGEGKTFIDSEDKLVHWYDAKGSYDGGFTSSSVIKRASKVIGLTARLDSWVANNFANSISANNAIMIRQKLTPQQRAVLREEITQAYSGADNAGSFLILDGGGNQTETKIQKLSDTAEQTQLAELRQQQVSEIARLFGVPSSFLSIDKAESYSSAIEQKRALAETIRPMALSFASAFSVKLLDEDEELILDTSSLTREKEIKLTDLIASNIITTDKAREMLGIYDTQGEQDVS